MSTIVRLEPPIWLHTPRGDARAFFLIDAGVDMDLMWVCFQHDAPFAGECWTYSNWDIRIMSNKTVGMLTKSPWEDENGKRAKNLVRVGTKNPTHGAIHFKQRRKGLGRRSGRDRGANLTGRPRRGR